MLSSVLADRPYPPHNHMEPRDATHQVPPPAPQLMQRDKVWQEAFSPHSGANPLITFSVASTFRSIE